MHPAISAPRPEARLPIAAVVFDLGGVLVDWDPRHPYRSLFAGDEPAMEAFLGTVCTPEWNALQDAGRPWAEALATLVEEHPAERERIVAFHERWPLMLGGAIEGTVEILAFRRPGSLRGDLARLGLLGAPAATSASQPAEEPMR